jgi:hypothetical protein
MMQASIIRYEVTNGNDFAIDDHFDGIPVHFFPGIAVRVSPQVVAHCFGYPGEARDMAVHMARRYGWATAEMLKNLSPGPVRTDPAYFGYAAKIIIRAIAYDLVARDPDEPILADQGGAGETAQPAPEEDGTKVVRRRRVKAAPKPKAPPRAGRKAGEGTGRGTRH